MRYSYNPLARMRSIRTWKPKETDESVVYWDKTGMEICRANGPATAEWIAERLNLASRYEAEIGSLNTWRDRYAPKI